MATTSKFAQERNESPSMEDIEAQIAELRREISSLTSNLASYGSAKVGDYKAEVDQFASDAVDASKQAFNNAKREAMALERSFEEQVRARPLQALGIAVGVGFLAALLTRR